MAKLKFEKDENDKPTRTALGMWSKDQEYVDLDAPCNLDGQVSDECGRMNDESVRYFEVFHKKEPV